MLQIVSGKFFGGGPLYETLHRGTFYTNYRVGRGGRLETPVGALLPSTAPGGLATLTYEVVERIEAVGPDGRPGAFVSTLGVELASDLAAVVSFVLGVTCTPDADLARRLLAGEHLAPSASGAPRGHLRRVFDAQVASRPGDAEDLAAFMAALTGLERRAFEGAIRAVRRYVTASHRLADDVSLAHAMLVMSIESLAQGFDGHEPVWADYEEAKRRRIDDALDGVPGDAAERVRAAVLHNEHVALSRRFCDFALAHLDAGFFREGAAGAVRPCGRMDLREALRQAYAARSGYVHTLRETPPEFWGRHGHPETVEVDGKPALTFQGLARLAKHVIERFVAEGPKVEREAFEWRSALPGIIRVPLAAECWVHRAEGYTAASARRYLAGFLDQVSAIERKEEGAKLTDLGAVLEKVEAHVPGLARKEQRLPMLALYLLFHRRVPERHHRPGWIEFMKRHEGDFGAPSVESMVVHLVLGLDPPWPLAELDALHRDYVRQRRTAKGLHVGELLEAAFALALAEKKRIDGDEQGAREAVCRAVEGWPGCEPLVTFEAGLRVGPLPPIAWRPILLGQPTTERG